ncbi:MAG: hypothetical protein K2Y40_03350 [Reyranella sp.]|nr:hypothetical protein [Reyranella sp.]
MRRLTARCLFCLVLSTGAMVVTPLEADDRELQAILLKLQCTPTKIVTTDLSPTVASYEVTCRRSGRIVHVVCIESDCRQQLAPREQDERQ